MSGKALEQFELERGTGASRLATMAGRVPIRPSVRVAGNDRLLVAASLRSD